MPGGRDTRSAIRQLWPVVVFSTALTLCAAWLFVLSLGDNGCTTRAKSLLSMADWLDPVFFQYNLALALCLILVVPVVSISYMRTVGDRRVRKLQHEVPPARIRDALTRWRELDGYADFSGSVLMATIAVAMGISILLFLKPVNGAGGANATQLCGVDYARGVNILLAGPYVSLYGSSDSATLYRHVVNSLVGFQFGFLGAYIYLLISISRAYCLVDLTRDTFVDGAIRIGFASFLSLIIAFCFERTSEAGAAGLDPARLAQIDPKFLPAVSFFFGFFPARALIVLQNLMLRLIQLLPSATPIVPLSELGGVSYAHQMRLEREGYDSIDDLALADPLDLAVRTPFSYARLRFWVEEAWLRIHLQERYPDFTALTGIRNRSELAQVAARCKTADPVLELLPDKLLGSRPTTPAGLGSSRGTGVDAALLNALRAKVRTVLVLATADGSV